MLGGGEGKEEEVVGGLGRPLGVPGGRGGGGGGKKEEDKELIARGEVVQFRGRLAQQPPG